MWFKKKQQIVSCVQACPRSNKCPKWVIFARLVDGKEVADGRCADAWTPQLLIELREEIRNAFAKKGRSDTV